MEPEPEIPFVPENSKSINIDVQIPEEVMYCPYNGSYQDQINKASELNNFKMIKALIKYRDDMLFREKVINNGSCWYNHLEPNKKYFGYQNKIYVSSVK